MIGAVFYLYDISINILIHDDGNVIWLANYIYVVPGMVFSYSDGYVVIECLWNLGFSAGYWQDNPILGCPVDPKKTKK